MSVIRFAAVAALCLAPAVYAAKPAPAEDPAVDTTQQAGTTILGERESDQGLYLTPWKEEYADNIDPPPGLLDVQPAPVEPRAFARQVRDAATIAAYRRELSR
ncbi:MAG TPA: hypothetical protein VFA75_15510 [Nevskia sp.]|jgi:hypothetical protein|nr:hypothetical protein [Nevskia sp.]